MENKKTISKALGAVVVKYRKEHNMVQAELAYRLETDCKYLSDVELGKRKVSLSFFARLASVMEMSMHELMLQVECEMSGCDITQNKETNG